MANLEALVEKIREFQRRFRRDPILSISISEIYHLKKPENEPNAQGWPDSWPQADCKGIYAIFSSDRLLYIGKASQQALGARLSSYFRYGPNDECVINPQHNWTSDPTHIVTWAVPEDRYFEAVALEEFLIHELPSNDLPDNTAGKRR